MSPLRFLSFTLLALMTPLACVAQELPKHLVCYDDIFQPFFMREGDTFTGLNVDLVAEAGHRLGITIEFRQIPFKRLELELSQGNAANIECGFSFSRTEAREKYLTFGRVPIQPTDYMLFVRTELHGIETLDALVGKVIGVRAGFRLPEIITEGVKTNRWHIEEAGGDDVNFKKLMLGRIDAVLTNRDVGLYTLHELKIDGVHPISPPLTHLDTYMVFPKNQKAEILSAAFDNAFSSMVTDGTINRLREKYLGRDGTP